MTSIIDLVTNPELSRNIQRATLMDSIAGQICDIRQMNFPQLTASYHYRDKNSDKVIVNNRIIQPNNYITKSEYTIEALEDIQSMYGEDLKDIIEYYIKNDQVKQIDRDLIAFCKDKAKITEPIVITEFEKINYNVSTRIAQERISMVLSSETNLKQFAIVSPKIAGHLLSRISNQQIVDNLGLAYVTSFGSLDVYMDHYHNPEDLDYVILGFKGGKILGGSLVLGTYLTANYFSQDPNSTLQKLFHSNRIGFDLTPMDTATGISNYSNYLSMFTVDLSAF